MITMGCDVGSIFTKVVLLDEDKIIGKEIVRTTGTIANQLPDILSSVIKNAGLSRKDVEALVGTGSGADLIPGVDLVEDEITCIAAAAGYYLPDVELVVSVGGQSIAAMTIDEEGLVTNMMRNDKCASGSGRFLEVMANKLRMPIEEIDPQAAQSKAPVEISAQCGVFAESEVITHVNDGRPLSDIVAGICGSVARIILSQTRRFTLADHYTFCGGVARFTEVSKRVQQRLPGTFHAFPHDPLLAAAVGAALLGDSEE